MFGNLEWTKVYFVGQIENADWWIAQSFAAGGAEEVA
jgi:hypothetical protein